MIFIPGSIFFLMAWLAVLSLVWAPFAASICALIAKRNKLSASRYAITGAAYSILFFIPWVYLLTKLLKRPLPVSMIRLGYFFLYTLWILGPIGFIITLLIVFSETFRGQTERPTIGAYIFLLACIAMLALSRWQVNIAREVSENRRSLPRLLPLPFLYLSPFIYAYINVLLMLLFIFVSPEVFID